MFAAQGIESAHPAFVARAPRLDAFADPAFFFRQALVEQRVVRGLGRELLGLLGLEFGVVARVFAEPAAVEFDDARGQARQKLAIVGDEQQRAAVFRHHVFQPLDGLDVEVVGGLVQQQHVRLHDQRPAERHPALPAAGKLRHRHIRRQVEAGQYLFDTGLRLPAMAAFELLLQLMHPVESASPAVCGSLSACTSLW